MKNSVTIGVHRDGTYQSIDGAQTALGSVEEDLDERTVVKNEFKNAKEALKATGKLPISIDNQCLMSMQDGRDCSIVLKLFKTACLSYAPTDVTYREHKMSRTQLLGMRRDLLDKVNDYMHTSGLHKEGSIYPRRYFDDIIMEQQLSAQQSRMERQLLSSSVGDSGRLQELLAPKLPFGLPSAKQSASYAAKNAMLYPHSASFANAKLSSPHISREETAVPSNLGGKQGSFANNNFTSRFTASKLNVFQSPSDRNFTIPGVLTLDTDSEAEISKLHIRDKLMNNSTTRNIRNKTIDVPSLQGSDFATQRRMNGMPNILRSHLSNVD